MQIEKLRQYKTSDDGCHWYWKPTTDDIINKINEIIDYINSSENLCVPFGGEYINYASLNNNFCNEACKDCSANPKNGGDGICFCILGQREWRQ